MSTPASVQEKITKLESTSASDDVRNILATTSTKPPESLNNPEGNTETKVEDVEKKSDDHDEELDFDSNKFASKKDYETYKGRFRKLILPSKHFRMNYENALEKLDLNSLFI